MAALAMGLEGTPFQDWSSNLIHAGRQALIGR